MTQFQKPSKKPSHPYFGSGPCNKVPNWDIEKIKNSFICRSHRSTEGLKRLNEAVSLMRVVLNIPDSYFLGIIPGSATGAIEAAIWNLIGQRPLSVLTHDAFSLRWESDIVDQLKIKEVSITRAKHGDIPQTGNIPKFNDILLNWNGSTSGACFPFSTFKNKKQDGLIMADITSAAFCMEIPWADLDASAFSWQKGLGGEAGIGVLVLSPKAINRLETYKPSWPIPYLLQLRDKKGVKFEIFQERTINTPSMISVEDFLNALSWAKDQKGIKSVTAISKENLNVIEEWVEKTDWVGFLTEKKVNRSSSTIVIKVIHSKILSLSESKQRDFIQTIAEPLESNKVAYDIINHPLAPPSIRIWGGPTIKKEDLKLLLDWIDWSFQNSFSKISSNSN